MERERLTNPCVNQSVRRKQYEWNRGRDTQIEEWVQLEQTTWGFRKEWEGTNGRKIGKEITFNLSRSS